MSQYRPEVDGLRTVAVMSVVIFHVWPHALPGGYLGVDVFFVISGYLITKIIYEQLNEGRFSLSNFYIRRIRRILPAQLLVVLLTILAFMFLLSPTELSNLGHSSIYAVLSLANVYFWLESGYFGALSENSPLLHMWSLGVEEQFYLVWPFVLMLALSMLRPMGRAALVILVLALFFGSLLSAELLVRSSPAAAFYLFFTRIFEFVVGGVIALGFVRRPRSELANQAIGLAALAVLVASFFWFNEATRHPSAWTLIPCLATGALILSGSSRGVIGALLANKGSVHVGLLSYSLYLTHWPVVVGYRIVTGDAPSLAVGVALIALMYVLAALLHYGWERPLRYGRVVGMARFPTVGLVAALSVVSLFGASHLWANNKVGETLQPGFSQVAVADGQPVSSRFDNPCPGRVRSAEALTSCSADILVIGDSHADRTARLMETALQMTGADTVTTTWTLPGCPPLFGAIKIYNSDRPVLQARQEECREIVEAWQVEVAASAAPIIVLSARWAWLTEPGPWGAGREREDALVLSEDEARTSARSREVMRASLGETVRVLTEAGKRVVLVGQAPLHSGDSIACAERLALSDDADGLCWTDAAAVRSRHYFHASLFAEIAAGDGEVLFLDQIAPLCDADRCYSSFRGDRLYNDRDHISDMGAIYVARSVAITLAQFIAPMIAPDTLPDPAS